MKKVAVLVALLISTTVFAQHRENYGHSYSPAHQDGYPKLIINRSRRA